ncbi:unnamed protein product, partial [Medioppia subpectinata]
MPLAKIFCNEKHKDVLLNDYGKSWESLRRVAHKTIRNYAKTQALSEVVANNVRQMVDSIITTEGIGKPFPAKLYAYNLFANILGSVVFSEKFDIEQPELKKFKYITTDFQTDLGSSMFVYEFIPIVRYFMANPLAKYEQYFNEMKNFTRNIYQKHSKTYNSKNLRDFCDILIAAKHEAIADDKQSAQYFTDDNLLATLSDLFIGGVETSQSTFLWIMLFMAYYPDYQDKLHNEISHEIGDRVPVIEDKSLLNYTLAFVSEILRYKNPAPMGVFHKALVDSKLGEHPVPEGTSLLVHQSWIMMDPKHWTNPDKFEPERFLDEHGQYLQTKFAAYMPFSCGRRICPGETLAINDLFLILVNFLQLTKDYRIELHTEHGENTRDVIEPDLSTQALAPVVAIDGDYCGIKCEPNVRQVTYFTGKPISSS